jgi:hypothetical protein
MIERSQFMLLLCSVLISIVLALYYGFTDIVAGKWHWAITGTVAVPENYRRCGELMVSVPHVIGLLLNVLLTTCSLNSLAYFFLCLPVGPPAGLLLQCCRLLNHLATSSYCVDLVKLGLLNLNYIAIVLIQSTRFLGFAVLSILI